MTSIFDLAIKHAKEKSSGSKFNTNDRMQFDTQYEVTLMETEPLVIQNHKYGKDEHVFFISYQGEIFKLALTLEQSSRLHMKYGNVFEKYKGKTITISRTKNGKSHVYSLSGDPVASPVPTPVAQPAPTPVASPVPTPVASPAPLPVTQQIDATPTTDDNFAYNANYHLFSSFKDMPARNISISSLSMRSYFRALYLPFTVESAKSITNALVQPSDKKWFIENFKRIYSEIKAEETE